MAVKYRTRTNTRCYIEEIERRGYSGVTLHVRYREEGPKHQTYVTHKIELEWCGMLKMNDRFHAILSGLKDELDRARARLRGE